MKKAFPIIISFVVIAIIGYTFWEPSGPDADEQAAYYKVIEEHRQEKDEMFAEGRDSPLTAAQKADFKGLNYFPPNWTFRFTAQIDRFSDEDRKPVLLATSTGEEEKFRPVGKVFFRSGSKRLKLTLYQSLDKDKSYFLPFRDLTTGESTYPAGRYLEPKVRGNVVELDFNYAYNPYCAYNDNYSCPLPPEENQLDLAVEAGEKRYHTE